MSSMKKTLITILILCLFTLCGCQPQQTDILTEIRRPDGSVVRYVNRSNGYGYNPNVTGNINVGGVEGTSNATIMYNNGWNGAANYGYPYFYYVPGCGTPTPGAVPIPHNMNIYNYRPLGPGIRY